MKYGKHPEGLDDEQLRQECRRAFSMNAPIAATGTPEPPAVGASPIRPKGIPNLGSTGKWEGRKRLVTIIKRDNTKQDYAQPVGWDGVIWNVPVGVPVEMPWPYWESLKNTKLLDSGSDAVSKWERGQDGRMFKIVTPTLTDTIRHIDHGDVPGTEELPTSYWDFFFHEARKTNCFYGKSRSMLVHVHNILMEPKPMTFYRDMKDDDIRLAIAQSLGTEIENVLQSQMYAEA